tara:strand:- start:135 stop:542 length:408 start_codon:yes stop_codon:yes gene_type:complete
LTKELILLTIAINIFSSFIFLLLVKGYNKYKPIERFLKMKVAKVMGFVFLFFIPLATIIYMLADKTLELNFMNVGLFVLVCVSLIFNILMNHITTIYGMVGQLANSGSDKLTSIDETFGKVYDQIKKLKKDNKLE